jgi:hypothetical protein
MAVIDASPNGQVPRNTESEGAALSLDQARIGAR